MTTNSMIDEETKSLVSGNLNTIEGRVMKTVSDTTKSAPKHRSTRLPVSKSLIKKNIYLLALVGLLSLGTGSLVAYASQGHTTVQDTPVTSAHATVWTDQVESPVAGAQSDQAASASNSVNATVTHDTQNAGQVHVEVNGQEIPVSPNGSVHKVVQTGNGQSTNVEVTTNTSTQATGSGMSTTTNFTSFSSNTNISTNHVQLNNH